MGAHFSFMWLKHCILIATRISKSCNVVFKHHSDQFHWVYTSIFHDSLFAITSTCSHKYSLAYLPQQCTYMTLCTLLTFLFLFHLCGHYNAIFLIPVPIVVCIHKLGQFSSGLARRFASCNTKVTKVTPLLAQGWILVGETRVLFPK